MLERYLDPHITQEEQKALLMEQYGENAVRAFQTVILNPTHSMRELTESIIEITRDFSRQHQNSESLMSETAEFMMPYMAALHLKVRNDSEITY